MVGGSRVIVGIMAPPPSQPIALKPASWVAWLNRFAK
jgi:hypothetical protein